MRAAIYLRFSSEMQSDGFSIAAQRRACEGYATARGWTIANVYSDEARSARSDNVRNRPGFQAMMRDAEKRSFDTIVVHKLDRFSRNRRIAFEAFEQLARHGVGFVSVSEDMDYSSPAGQLMLTMLVGLSQFYSDNLSFETKKGKTERKRQGKYNGKLPIGYRRATDGNAAPDDVEAPIVREVFRLSSEGNTDRQIAMLLNELGYRTKGVEAPGPFTKDAVRVILRNRFYLGELPDGEGWVTGNHPSIIDAATFDAVQRIRQRNATVGRGRRRQKGQAHARAPWALAGLCFCAQCGKTYSREGTKGYAPSIRCSGRKQGNGCTASGIQEYRVVDAVNEQFRGILALEENKSNWLSSWRVHQRGSITGVRDRTLLMKKLDRLKELYLEGDLDKTTYSERRRDLQAEINAIPADTDVRETTAEEIYSKATALIREWETADATRRNALAHEMIERVEIDTTNSKTVVRVTAQPSYEALFRTVLAGNPSCGGSDGIRLTIRAAPTPPQYRKKLTPEQETEILMRPTYSLRELAVQLGCSYETVRRVRKEAGSDR